MTRPATKPELQYDQICPSGASCWARRAREEPARRVVAAARVEVIFEPAAGVGEEMAHRVALGDVGVSEPRYEQIAPDWSVQIQLALLHELQGQCAGHRSS